MDSENISLLQEIPKKLCTRCNKKPPLYRMKCVFSHTLKAKFNRLFNRFHKNAIRTEYGILEWLCKECKEKDSFLKNIPIETN